MKINNILKSGMVALAALTIFSACDKDASEVTYRIERESVDCTVKLGLYVPDKTIENDVYNKSKCLDTCHVEGRMNILVDTRDQLGVTVSHLQREATFAVPFLEDNGHVRDAFANGYLAKLYDCMVRAKEQGLLPEDEYRQLYTNLINLHDTISVDSLAALGMSYRQAGALIHSWTENEKSAYSLFTLSDFNFTRRSNIVNVIAGMHDRLAQLNSQNFFTDEEKRILKSLQSHLPGGKVTNSQGYSTFAYSNVNIAFQMQVQSASGLLDMLSLALFGADADGNPNQEVWLIVDIKDNGFDNADIEILK